MDIGYGMWSSGRALCAAIEHFAIFDSNTEWTGQTMINDNIMLLPILWLHYFALRFFSFSFWRDDCVGCAKTLLVVSTLNLSFDHVQAPYFVARTFSCNFSFTTIATSTTTTCRRQQTLDKNENFETTGKNLCIILNPFLLFNECTINSFITLNLHF